jgi:hypothetical protein
MTSPLDQWSTNQFVTANALVYQYATAFAFLPLYAIFVGLAVRSPIAAPLRWRPLQIFFLGLVAIIGVELVIRPGSFVGPNGQPGRILGVGTLTLGWLPYVMPVWATLASVHAWIRAPAGSLARRRARAYVTAFVLLDAATIFGYGLIPGGATSEEIFIWGIASALDVAFAVALTLGLLRDQLLDFELKIKWTLKRGTLVAIILGAFFVATAIAEQYLQGYGFVVGGVAIGLLLFAIRPVERAIDRMADRAMPRTTGTPEYLAQRKHEIYRAAIEDMASDGAITVKERSALLRLAKNLELDGNDAMRIEGEVLAARSTPDFALEAT